MMRQLKQEADAARAPLRTIRQRLSTSAGAGAGAPRAAGGCTRRNSATQARHAGADQQLGGMPGTPEPDRRPAPPSGAHEATEAAQPAAPRHLQQALSGVGAADANFEPFVARNLTPMAMSAMHDDSPVPRAPSAPGSGLQRLPATSGAGAGGSVPSASLPPQGVRILADRRVRPVQRSAPEGSASLGEDPVKSVVPPQRQAEGVMSAPAPAQCGTSGSPRTAVAAIADARANGSDLRVEPQRECDVCERLLPAAAFPSHGATGCSSCETSIAHGAGTLGADGARWRWHCWVVHGVLCPYVMLPQRLHALLVSHDDAWHWQGMSRAQLLQCATARCAALRDCDERGLRLAAPGQPARSWVLTVVSPGNEILPDAYADDSARQATVGGRCSTAPSTTLAGATAPLPAAPSRQPARAATNAQAPAAACSVANEGACAPHGSAGSGHVAGSAVVSCMAAGSSAKLEPDGVVAGAIAAGVCPRASKRPRASPSPPPTTAGRPRRTTAGRGPDAYDPCGNIAGA